MIIAADLDLRARRLAAGLTQADLARRLNVTQSQVLRYEAKPDNVPLGIVLEWITACGDIRAGKGLDIGRPYSGLPERIRLLEQYGRAQPDLENGDTVVAPIGIEDLLTAIRELGRKPRVVVCGRYDAGKSRLANMLLGIDRLPTAYSPTTRIVCLIRHLADKPRWQREDVWIMGEGFTLDWVDDQERCERHRLVAGDFETLARFGQHSEESSRYSDFGEPVAALIYLDAPLLYACDLIDTPGLAHLEDDSALAGKSYPYGDIVLYLAPVNGFLNREDLRALSTIVGALPVQQGASSLRGLSILATHAHPGVSDADIASAIDTGATRAVRALAPLFTADNAQPIDALTFRSRCFAWYIETPARREQFEADLRDLLATVMPCALWARLNAAVEAFCTQCRLAFSREITNIRRLLAEHQAAEAQLRPVLFAEPERKVRTGERRQKIEQLIAVAKVETQAFIAETVAPILSAEELCALIEQNYTGSREAEQHVANDVMIKARAAVERFIESKAKPLTQEVESLLQGYELRVDAATETVAVPFDARSVFLGALVAGGTFGALASWAAITAAGSNLGAYLLVPQVVGLLARIGISIAGGTATGVSIVSAAGGPVGVGIGIAVTLGLVAWQVFGRSWQTRLARGLANDFQKQNVLGKIWVECERCWDETLMAFRRAAESTERQHKQHLERLVLQLQTPRAVLQARLARLEARQAFLSFLPWNPVSKDPHMTPVSTPTRHIV